MNRNKPCRALLLILSVAVLVVLFPAAQPASASGATFVDRQDDVAYYDWVEDQVYLDQDWDEVDIAQVDVTTTASAVQVSTRIVDLQAQWWDTAQVSYEVNGDGSEDFQLNLYWDGSWELKKVQGYNDPGYPIACGGVGVSVDYTASRITTLVPRSCLANTDSVAIQSSLYDDENLSCCNDWVLDLYPDMPGEYSSKVPYDDVTQPPPTPSYDPNGPTGTIYRLYRAYFLREPDKAGYDYWYGVYRNGYPLDKISNDFARSAEFQSRYGSLDNAQFLERVYQNVLGRSPDPQGYAYWTDQMNRGMLRGFVMIYFSDSEEFRSKTAAGRPPGY